VSLAAAIIGDMRLMNDPWTRPQPDAGLRGLRDNGRRIVEGLFAAFGLAWTVTEASAFFFDVVDDHRRTVFGVVVIGVAIGAIFVALPKRLLGLRRGSTRIEIGFGDLFAGDGVRIIAVNDLISSTLGDHVSPSSLHGQLIQREFHGDSESFVAAVAAGLPDNSGDPVEGPTGTTRRYPIGTTATVNVGENRYVLVVLSATDTTSLKVNADLKELTLALAAAWKAARDVSGGRAVLVPLLGSGLSAVGLSQQQLATVLLASLLEATGQQQIAPLVQVVLPVSLYGEVDLRALEATT